MDFDLEQLEAITGGDPDFERDVLDEYLNCAPSDVEKIRQAIAAQDAEALGRAAHALKGSSATIGARGLAELSKELEMAGKTGRMPETPAVFGRLTASFDQTCAWIRQRLARAA